MQTATPADSADFGNRLSAVESRLSRVEGIVEQMDKRFEAIERRLDSMERRLSAIERRFDWVIGLILTSWLSIVGLILWKLG